MTRVSFDFRSRFRLGDTVQLVGSQTSVTLDRDERVVLAARGGMQIGAARELVLRGRGYSSEDAALRAAAQWRVWLMLALARVNVGADFGDRAPRGGFTPAGIAALGGSSGQRVLNDAHGTMAFESEPDPVFASLGPARGIVGRPVERLVAAVNEARARDLRFDDRHQLAFDLYGASFSETSPDARFVMLMMAVETLIEPLPRPPNVAQHVDSLVALTRATQLPNSEKQSVLGTLRYLCKESISQAGRRLAARLGDRRYGDEAAPTFFTGSYDLRSRLVHGGMPRPTRDEVDQRAAHLEAFVSDLLSTELLAWSWLDESTN